MRMITAGLALLAFSLLAACSSKNPDELVAANVELNQPAPDASASANSEVADGNSSIANAAGPVQNAAATRSDPQVEAAVNSLKAIEQDDNVASQAEDEFNRENSDPDEQ